MFLVQCFQWGSKYDSWKKSDEFGGGNQSALYGFSVNAVMFAACFA